MGTHTHTHNKFNFYFMMSPQSERGSYEENREDEVEMKESNKRDRGDISIESVKDDQISPSHKKQRISKDAEKRMCQDIMALSKLLEKPLKKREMEPKIKCIRCKVSRHNCDNKTIDMNPM